MIYQTAEEKVTKCIYNYYTKWFVFQCKTYLNMMPYKLLTIFLQKVLKYW